MVVPMVLQMVVNWVEHLVDLSELQTVEKMAGMMAETMGFLMAE